MARRRVAEYTCDRCGKTQNVPVDGAGHDDPPVGWAKYERTPLNPPPRASGDTTEHPTRWEGVCPSCDAQTVRFLMNGSDTADRRPDEAPRLRSDAGLQPV
jgi:hypothetical protein